MNICNMKQFLYDNRNIVTTQAYAELMPPLQPLLNC